MAKKTVTTEGKVEQVVRKSGQALAKIVVYVLQKDAENIPLGDVRITIEPAQDALL